MADDLQRVGLVFKADGAVDFKKTLRQVTDELSSNRNEFDRAKISWDESTSSMEKLQDRQKYLSKQTQLYSDKVNILQRELAEMEKSEKSSSQEISKFQSTYPSRGMTAKTPIFFIYFLFLLCNITFIILY